MRISNMTEKNTCDILVNMTYSAADTDIQPVKQCKYIGEFTMIGTYLRSSSRQASWSRWLPSASSSRWTSSSNPPSLAWRNIVMHCNNNDWSLILWTCGKRLPPSLSGRSKGVSEPTGWLWGGDHISTILNFLGENTKQKKPPLHESSWQGSL